MCALSYFFRLNKSCFTSRDFASTETIDTSALASKKERLDNLDQANAEIEKLRKLGEKLTGELQGNNFFLALSFFHWNENLSFFANQSCGLFIQEAQCVSLTKLLPQLFFLHFLFFFLHRKNHFYQNHSKIILGKYAKYRHFFEIENQIC